MSGACNCDLREQHSWDLRARLGSLEPRSRAIKDRARHHLFFKSSLFF
jgi:hypothetical protein